MMKRLLFCAVSALFAFSASAVEVGDYVYTPGGRYLLTQATQINLSLDEEFTGWTSIGDDALPDCFAVDGGFVAASDGGASTKGLYRSFTLDNNEKTYVLVFDAKSSESNLAYSFTPRFLGSVQNYIAHLNVYGVEGGEYVNTATAAAPDGTKQADLGLGFQLTGEYQTYATALSNDGADLTWFIEMSQLLGGISVGNIKVFEAQQVFDNRFVQNKIDYLNAIINVYDWAGMDKTPEEQNLWDDLKVLPEELNNMADMASVEEGTAMIEDADGKVAKFVAAFFGDYAGDNAIRFQDGGGVSKGTGSVAGWATDTRWWHTKGNADLYWGNFAYNYNNSIRVTQTKSLPAGSYVFAVDSYMDAVGKKGTINNFTDGWYSPDVRSAVCRGELTLSILDETGEPVFESAPVALDNQIYKTGVVAFTIPQGQDGNYTLKILGADTYGENGWTTNASTGWGGNGYLNNLRIYFKAAGKYTAKQLVYIEKVREQIAAMRTAYDKSVSYVDDPDGKYYWYKWAVADTSDLYLPNLVFYESLTDDDIINGFDDPASMAAKEAAEAETGQEFPDWDYNLSFDKYDAGTQNAVDSLTNRAVRPLLRVNEHFLGYNQYLFDMLEAIDKAKVILNTRVFSGRIAYTTLEGAVGDAEAMFEDFKEDPGTVEDLVDSYIPAVQDITNSMNETMTNFYESGYNPGEEPIVIRSFDFEDASAFVLDDPATEPGTGSYTDPTGVMTIDNLNLTKYIEAFDSKGNRYNNDLSYNNGWLSEDEVTWTNQGMLRVGNADGTVALDGEDIVSGTDALHVSLEYYYGNLTGRSAGFYLKDAEGANVAGIWGSKYDGDWLTKAYNPFQIDGNKDISGLGRSGVADVAIAAESNKTKFDIYIDYGTKTMFCILNNSTQGVINKRFDAEMENQNPVAALVINSNYNNSGRRCWVDNILIEKIPLGTPPTPPTIKGDVNGDGIVNGTDIQAVINYILAGVFEEKADVNEDGVVNGTDIQEIINIIVNQN